MRNIWEDHREAERETGNGAGSLEEGWRAPGRRAGEGERTHSFLEICQQFGANCEVRGNSPQDCLTSGTIRKLAGAPRPPSG